MLALLWIRYFSLALAVRVLLPLSIAWMFINTILSAWKLAQFKSQRAKRTLYALLLLCCASNAIARGAMLIPVFRLPATYQDQLTYYDYTYVTTIFQHVADVTMALLPVLIVHFCLIATDKSLVRTADGWLVMISYVWVLVPTACMIAYLALPYEYSDVIDLVITILNSVFFWYVIPYLVWIARYSRSFGPTYAAYCLFFTLSMVYNVIGLAYIPLLQYVPLFCAFYLVCPCVAATIAVFFIPSWKWDIDPNAHATGGYLVGQPISGGYVPSPQFQYPQVAQQQQPFMQYDHLQQQQQQQQQQHYPPQPQYAHNGNFDRSLPSLPQQNVEAGGHSPKVEVA